MAEKTRICAFASNGCRIKTKACNDCDQEQCGEWLEKIKEEELCPIMLLSGYTPTYVSRCDDKCLPVRRTLKKDTDCHDGMQCLLVKQTHE
jgi:hypothetical protein